MARVAQDSFDEDDDDEPSTPSDREDPDPSDQDQDDDGDDAETVPCPYCRKPVYEQAEVCPHCRNFISFEDAPRRHPWWIWVGVILCLLVVLFWVL